MRRPGADERDHIGRAPSQLSPHGATRTTLPSTYGDLAALWGPVPPETFATALLLPGYTGSKEDFAPLLDPVAAAGILPVAIDLPGQFESPGPADESAYLPRALGEVVAELAGKLAGDGTAVLLLGHSFGGLVARGAVLAGAPVAGLTLLDSGPARLPDGYRLTAIDRGEPLLRERGAGAAYRLREYLTARRRGETGDVPGLNEFLRERFTSSSEAGLLGMALGLRTEPDRVAELASALAEAAIPSLVVAGRDDDAWSVPSQRAMADRLGAAFALIDGAAHSPNTENPQALLDVLLPAWLAWLGRPPSPS